MSFIRKHLPPTLHNAGGAIIAGLVLSLVGVGAVSPRVRALLSALARDLDMRVPFWLVLVLGVCLLLGLIQVIRWVTIALLPADVRLFRSLGRNERIVLRRLARSEYGLTEWELSEAVPVPTQQFLHIIDRLVTDLHLAERTERQNGGVFWTLSEKGRKIAATNGLFSRAVNLKQR